MAGPGSGQHARALQVEPKPPPLLFGAAPLPRLRNQLAHAQIMGAHPNTAERLVGPEGVHTCKSRAFPALEKKTHKLMKQKHIALTTSLQTKHINKKENKK